MRRGQMVRRSDAGRWSSLATARYPSQQLGRTRFVCRQPARNPPRKHAALEVSRRSFSNRCLDVRTRVIVREQLRAGSAPNPWETAWLVWDYLDNEHFSYLAIKTNGWELGKRDPAYSGGQRFLATGDAPATAAGQWRNAHIKRTASADGLRSTIRAFVGGVNIATFGDTEQPVLQREARDVRRGCDCRLRQNRCQTLLVIRLCRDTRTSSTTRSPPTYERS